MKSALLGLWMVMGLVSSAPGIGRAQSQPAPEGSGPSSANAPPTAQAAPAAATGPAVDEAAEAERLNLARQAYARGQTAYAAGDYATALVAFKEAHRISPNPVVLRSIAKSEERLGRVPDAIVHLSAYLREASPTAADRAQVEQELSELRERPGTLAFRLEPADAVVQIDGEAIAFDPASYLTLAPGDHEVSIGRTGYEGVTQAIHVVPGGRQVLQVTLVAKPLVPPAAVASGSDQTAVWVACGISAAGLVAGSILGYMALEENSEFDANPSVASADRGERLALFSDVAFGVAGMAAVTAAVLFFTGEQSYEGGADAEQLGALQWGVTPLPGGGAATARIRY